LISLWLFKWSGKGCGGVALICQQVAIPKKVLWEMKKWLVLSLGGLD